MEKLPSENRPNIARFGEILDSETVRLMKLASDELNLTLDEPMFVVIAGSDSYFSFDGSRLPEGKQRIVVSGDWEQNGDIDDLWARVDELKSESL